MIVGVENTKTVFLFTDEQVLDESFLEIINNLLTTGIVSALFTDEEKDGIVTSCRNAAKDANYGVTKLVSLLKYFNHFLSLNYLFSFHVPFLN
jgi:dynein heavy chain